MSILEKLTTKQTVLCEKVAEEYIRDLTKSTKPNMRAIRNWLNIAYGLYDKKTPDRIEIVASPFAACSLASELTGEKQTTTDYCGIDTGGWVSFYDYFHQIGVLKDEEAEHVLALRDFARCAWDTILLDECAIVVRRPTALRLDDAGSLHAANKPCIEWADGNRDFSWHGTWVPEKVIMNPRGYTREEYLAITNTEERRALSEAAGWGWVAELLGAKSIDLWTDSNTGLVYDLLRCTDGLQLLSKQSPMLKDGSQPRYLEPVHEDLKTAQAARKWQATTMNAADCESDPVLKYGTEA